MSAQQLELSPVQVVWIYGFVERGRVLYVGQTTNRFAREQQHRKRSPILAQAKFVTLRRCNQFTASRIEGELIDFYRRKGEAQFNGRSESSNRVSYGSSDLPARVEINGLRFNSFCAAGRSLGVSPGTIKNYAKYPDRAPRKTIVKIL